MREKRKRKKNNAHLKTLSLSMNLSINLNKGYKQHDAINIFAILLFHPSEERGSSYSNLLYIITFIDNISKYDFSKI